jgi:WD40 repeat protein
VKVWDLQSRSEVRTLSGHTDSVDAVAVTPDGHYAISGSLDRTIKVWDLLTGTECYTLQGHSSSVTAIAVAPSGTRAISTSLDHTLKLWDLGSRKLMATFSADGAIYACAVQPDGRPCQALGDVLTESP